MKLYIIIRWNYNLPISNYTVEYIYTESGKAQVMCSILNTNNDDPVVSDTYGPISGSRYDIWERYTDE